MAEILVLGVVLIVLAIGIFWWATGREEQVREQAGLASDVALVAADLGRSVGGLRKLRLWDPALGLCGTPDLVQERGGILEVVEEKTVTRGEAPRRPREADRLQLASYLLLCERDPRVGRTARGILRYQDPQGVCLPGGEFPLELTEALRRQVIETVQAMRRALAPGAEVHRNHNRSGRCAGCDRDVWTVCGESLVGLEGGRP